MAVKRFSELIFKCMDVINRGLFVAYIPILEQIYPSHRKDSMSFWVFKSFLSSSCFEKKLSFGVIEIAMLERKKGIPIPSLRTVIFLHLKLRAF